MDSPPAPPLSSGVTSTGALAAPPSDGGAGYLREHNLPLLLDHLVARLAVERPADPQAWLADQLALEMKLRRGNRSMVPTLAAPAKAANPALPR